MADVSYSHRSFSHRQIKRQKRLANVETPLRLNPLLYVFFLFFFFTFIYFCFYQSGSPPGKQDNTQKEPKGRPTRNLAVGPAHQSLWDNINKRGYSSRSSDAIYVHHERGRSRKVHSLSHPFVSITYKRTH